MSTVTTYGVTGMTCGHCVAAVTEEVSALPGVQDVAVDLVEGGTSAVHVRSEQELSTEQVRAAVDEAGYTLADASA
jgi:copper chaperone CopZ